MKAELKKIIIKQFLKWISQLSKHNYVSMISHDNITFDGNIRGKEIETLADNIISKLPNQIITEDRIVEVLNNHLSSYSVSKNIAHEILQGQEWEVVASGEVTTYKDELAFTLPLINGFRFNIDSHLYKFEGKNIEIAVREIK
jgi:hypothetical protein